ncbi:LytR C-terminal domain-containing protein [Schumannella luteola]
MASYPKDRFDELPSDLQRVGAHRGPRPRGRGWIIVAWSALATGLLVFGGLFGISKFLNIDLEIGLFPVAETPTPTPTPTPTADPIEPGALDPARNITITVLNGTPIVGLQNTVGQQLAALGWPVLTTANASASDIEKTYVYYSDPANEDVARGLVVSMGKGDIRLVSAETFPGAPITIVLGADEETPADGETPAP